MSSLAYPALVIEVSGGVLTDLRSSGPVTAAFLDYDTDGTDDTVIHVPQAHGKPAPARLSVQANEYDPERVAAVAAILPPVDVPVSFSSAIGRAVVIMKGGVIHNVLADQPLRVIVVDYDIEGLDEDEEADLQDVPQGLGQTERARADDLEPEYNPAEVHALYELWAPTSQPKAAEPRRPRARR